jgi:hypothetical protein
MIGFGVLLAAWLLYNTFIERLPEFQDSGPTLTVFAFSGGLILFGIQRIRTRSIYDYAEEVVCAQCNNKKTSGARCPRCGG